MKMDAREQRNRTGKRVYLLGLNGPVVQGFSKIRPRGVEALICWRAKVLQGSHLTTNSNLSLSHRICGEKAMMAM